MRRQHTELAVLLTLFVVAELLLDAVAEDYLKQLIQQYVGTLPAVFGFLAVLALIYVRVSKYEVLVGKKRTKKRRR